MSYVVFLCDLDNIRFAVKKCESTDFVVSGAARVNLGGWGLPIVTAQASALYAQVVQADGSSNRNILLSHRYGTYNPEAAGHKLFGVTALTTTHRDRIGRAVFTRDEVEQLLAGLGLPRNSPLSVLAVELLPGGVGDDIPHVEEGISFESLSISSAAAMDPMGRGLLQNGRAQRILRVSPLVPVAPAC